MRFRRRMRKPTNKGHEEQVKKTKGIACDGDGIRLASTISTKWCPWKSDQEDHSISMK